MENKHENLIDNLNTPSVIEKEPLFSLKNYLKPTPKNILIWGDILVALGGMIGVSAIATLSTWIAVGGMVISGLGIILQRLTKEEPLSTVGRAVEDIQVEQVEQVEQKS